MVDTPRTSAYLTGTAFPDGQAAGSIVPQRMRDFAVSVPFWDDPGNASGLSAPALLRGTVVAHMCSGVTVGTGQSLGTRQATVAGLNAAILYAATNKKWFEIHDGIYELDNTGGVVIPPNFDNFRWIGSNGVFLRQFHSNAPILSIGSQTNTSTDSLYGYIIDGVTCQYGATQTGQTGANAIQIGAGQVGYCVFRNMTASNTPGFNPYRAFWTSAGSTYAGNLFACEFANIKAQGAQQDLLVHGLMGEGNNWSNIFVNQGSGTPGTIAGDAVRIGSPFGAGGADETWNGLHIDFVKAGGAQLNIFNITNTVMNGVHIEEAAGPSEFIQMASCTNLVMNGVHFLNTNNLAAAGGTSSAGFFYLYDNESLVINGLAIDWGGSGFADTAFAFIFHDQTATDTQPRITADNIIIFDTSTGRAQANLIQLIDRTVTTWVPPDMIAHYTFDSAISRIEGAEWMSCTTTRTIYGQFTHSDILVPAALAGNITISLSPLARSGSTLPCKTGNTIHIKRQAGTATNTLTINNNVTLLVANTTANTDFYYAYNLAGTGNWAAYTP
jgi:hypothetical protein